MSRSIPLSFALLSIALLSIALSGCGSAPVDDKPKPGVRIKAPAEVIGKTWQWLGTFSPQGRVDVQQPARYELTLLPNGRTDVKADCNKGNGAYQIGEGTLTFAPMISTRAACPPDTQDSQFTSALLQTDSFYVEGGELFLASAKGGIMRFTPAPNKNSGKN